LNDLKAIEHDFKAMERYKENLAQQIRALASNAMDSVDRFEKKFERQSLKGKIDDVAQQIKADQEASAPAPAALEPLVDPSTTVAPEAPSNDSIDAGVDDALAHQHTYQSDEPAEAPNYETRSEYSYAETEEDLDHLAGQGEEPEEAGLPTVSSVMQRAQETQQTEAEREPKKGRWFVFFDQI